MDTALFYKNIAAIETSQPTIAEKITAAAMSHTYKELKHAKTGHAIPVFQSNQAVHSLYDPEKEAERLIHSYCDCGFILFCGIGAGIHIRAFLKNNPRAVCAITEADYPSFKQLLHLLDYTDILSNPRIRLLPPCTDPSFGTVFIQTYIPALHGTFNCLILRVWKLFFTQQTAQLLSQIEQHLTQIRTDFSVQAHFGKIWMRNIFSNLQTAEKIHPAKPEVDTSQTAFVLGAGPSLEHAISTIQANRQKYVVFCTDTAFPVVSAHSIIPEFFISLDPQHISYTHTLHSFSPKTIGIFDLCADTAVVKRFKTNGNTFFFTSGTHPIAQHAAHYAPIPLLDTSSGTVAITAYHAAQALGFSLIKHSGMDFAYTNGQSYARGTYLSHQYAKAASRVIPEETSFVRLMFRTEIQTIVTAQGITYTTPVLDSYRKVFGQKKIHHPLWKKTDFSMFPYTQFIRHFEKELHLNNKAMLQGLLPYKAWYMQYGRKKFSTWELALDNISVYTGNK